MKSFCIFIIALWSLQRPSDVSACTGLSGVPSVPLPTGGLGGRTHEKKKCLHSESLVLMADGKSYTKAGELVVGDRVWDEVGPTSVILAPITELSEVQSFIQFRTEKGFGTTLTPEHAVFARPCGVKGPEAWSIKKSVDLNIGDCVPTVDGIEDKVVSIGAVDMTGRVQPITATGRIATGGVYVSCYDHVKENVTQEENHAALEPARLMFGWAEKIYNSLSNDQFALGILDSMIKGMGLEKFYYQ